MTELRLHGLPSLTPAGQAEPLPLSAREAALLAWIHLEGPTPRGPIAARLWPGGGDARARANLRQLIARLRRSAGAVLDERDGVLRLAADVVVARAPGRLLGPMEFDDTPTLADWLESRRDAERREWLRDGLAQAREALERDALDEALAQADRVLDADAAVEEAHRLRMQVFWRRGDRAAAVQAWDDCRHALRQQFGVAPSAATQALGQRILADEARSLAASAAPSGAAPDGVPPLPAELQRPPRQVGRDRLLQRARAALREGRPVVVLGEGGLGKSRLLEALAQDAGPSLGVAARPGDAWTAGALAARLVATALRHWNPALDARTRDEVQRLTGVAARPADATAAASGPDGEPLHVLATVLRACHGAGLRLLVLDDLQAADAWSLQALAWAWAGAPEPRAALPAVVLAGRPAELPPRARQLIDTLGSARAERLALAPLDAGESAALLAQVPLPPALAPHAEAVALALHRQVGGNPAFLLESVRALWREPPAGWQPGQPLPLAEGLRAQVQQRLQRLSPPALQLAQLAAVTQQDFSLALAAACMGCAPLALAPWFDELEQAQVFSAGGFAHDLVAEAVDAALPGSLRAPLHRLVAEQLQHHDGEPAALARHWQAAGQPREAARWALRAGERALGQRRLAAATEHFDAAAETLLAAGDRAGGLQALRGAARALANRSRMADSAARLERAAPLVRSDGERVQLLSLQVLTGMGLQRHAPVREGLQQLLALLGELGGARLGLAADDLVRAWFSLAWGARLARIAVPARHRLQALLAALAPDDALQLPLQLCDGMLAQAAGAAAEACRRLRPALGRIGERAQLAWLLNGAHALARAALSCGDDEALQQSLAWMEHALTEGGFGDGFRVDVDQVHAMRLLALRQPAAALQRCEAAQQRLQALGRPPRVQLATLQAAAELACGDADAALRRLDALPPGDGGPDADEACRQWVRARALHRLGRPCDEALALAREADPRCDDGVDSPEWATLACALGLRGATAPAAALLAERPALQALLAAGPEPQPPRLGDPWLGP